MQQIAHHQYYFALTWIILISRLIKTDDSVAVCEPRGQSHPDYSKCPTKACKKHIDCWVTFGAPQSCVCDPHLCGPVCLVENAKCPKPKSPANGVVIFNETNVADAAEYKCGIGLVVRGPRTRYCLATLNWSGEEPTCSNQTDTCFSPPDIPNSYLSAHRNSGQTFGPEGQSSLTSAPRRADYRSGEVIELRCLPGYQDTKRDYVEASCIGSEWHFAHLQCERIYCSSLRDPHHGIIVYRSDKRFQAEATTICEEGYTADCYASLEKDRKEEGCVRVCQADGQWSGRDSQCEPVTCPRLDAPTNGGLSTYTVSVHSVVHFHCNEGFEMQGPGIRRCLPNGKWDGTQVVCKERDCGVPPIIAQAKVVYNTSTYGSRAEFQCAPDTTSSIAEPALVCGTVNNKTVWLPQQTPRCNRHCYLFTVDQGEVVLLHKPNTSQQLLIPITADSYESIAKSGSPGGLPSSAGIILPGGRVRHNSQLNVSCQSGYQLAQLKMSVTTCKDGVWSIRSKCVPASCAKRPPSTRGARVRFYSRMHNAKARYECFPGYTLQIDTQSKKYPGTGLVNDPLGTIRCLHGEWVGTPVYCEPTRCPRLVVDKMISIQMKPSTLPNDGQQFTNEAVQGTQAFLYCPKGYHIQGPSVVVCHESHWLPSTDARCERSIYPVLPTEWLYRLP